METTEPLGIYRKLLEIRQELKYLKDDAKGQFGRGTFTYVSESALLGVLRPKLDELKVWFEQELVTLQTIPAEEKVNGFIVIFKYTFIDTMSGEKIVRKQSFILKETTPQAIGSLMTYGMRYFLYRFFIVPMDSLDPDQAEKKYKKAILTKKSESITKAQVGTIEKLLDGQSKDTKDGVMLFACGSSWKKDNKTIADIPPDKYTFIVKRLQTKLSEGKADES